VFLTNRKSVVWRWIAGALLAALVASYLWVERGPEPAHGGSAWGLGYGIAAAALVLLLAAFGWRKRAYRSKLGTLEGWLQSHVYLGVLVLVVALFHSGFRFQDRVATAALATLALVVASGLVGAAFYTVYPRLLTEVQSNLSTAEISERLNRLTASMARLVAGRSRAFEGVYREVVVSSSPRGLAGWKLLLGRLPGEGEGWSKLLGRVPPEEQAPLRQLLMLARQHRELHLRLAYQERYKNLLDVWLWLHVPLTVLLIILIVAHVVAALYFRGV
jgi:cytochrome b561